MKRVTLSLLKMQNIYALMCQMEIMIICHPLSNQVLLARNILCTIGYLLFINNSKR
nr:MAG TPA: hypothetical protein [Caudoviricetes sp.]